MALNSAGAATGTFAADGELQRGRREQHQARHRHGRGDEPRSLAGVPERSVGDLFTYTLSGLSPGAAYTLAASLLREHVQRRRASGCST